jgi:multidrug resistance efflux pump
MTARELLRPLPDSLQETVSPEVATATPAGNPEARPARRGRSGLLIGGLLLLAAALPAAVWLQHQSAYVVSRNALVRAQLSDLGTRIEGVVSEVYVDAGDRVVAGEVLLRLEDAHLQAELRRVRAEFAALGAQEAAERSDIEASRERARLHIAEAEAQVRRATAALQAATLQADDASAFHRAREALLPRDIVSKEVVRDAAARANTAGAMAVGAAAEQEAAINRLAQARHVLRELAVREQRLDVLAAERAQAAARVSRAEADLAATLIRAPADGAIIRRLAQPGMAVDVGTPALSMWFSDDTWVEAWVSEAALADIAIGSPVRVTSPALRGESISGVVRTVGLATDFEMPLDHLPQSRAERLQQDPLVGIAVTLDRLPDILRPGMSAVVNIARQQP